MLKKICITVVLAITLVDLYRYTILSETLSEFSITLALCTAAFYLFNHLIVRVYLDSILDQDD